MKFTIANHNNEKNPKGFINYDVDFIDIPKIISLGFAYSASSFIDNYRKNDNWIGGVDLLILDIDEDCTIEQAKEIFKKYEFYIITTRSHRKLKNDLISDRFRVFLHLDSTINDALTYDNFMKTTVNQYPFIDSKATDKGRFFFSSPVDALVFYNEGKKYPVLIVDPTIKKTLQAKKEIKSINFDDIYILEEMTGIWINSFGETLEVETYENDSIEPKLKGARTLLDNEFYKGNRNHCLFKVVSMLLNDELDDQTVLDFITIENDSRGGVKFNELMAVYRSALKTTGKN